MNYSVNKSSVIVLIIILCNKLSKVETIPNFCDTPLIHGVYNFGDKILLRYLNWIWTYDTTSHSMIEPPIDESNFMADNGLYFPNDYKIKTTLYINKVMGYPCLAMEPKDCDQQQKALDLMFIRLLDVKKTFEFTHVIHLTVRGEIKSVSAEEFPWNLGKEPNFWPKEWIFDTLYDVRPSAFSPIQRESYFITHSGDKNSSKLLYNKIDTNDWYENLTEVHLKSDIKFVGMFYLSLMQQIYAVGDRNIKGDDISRVYLLDNSTDMSRKYYFTDTDRDVREFFGCKPVITTSTTIDIKTTNHFHSSTSVEDPVEAVCGDAEDDKFTIIFIVVVVFVVILILIVIIVVIVVIKLRGRKRGSVSMIRSEMQNSSALDKTSTVVTINSESGSRVNPK